MITRGKADVALLAGTVLAVIVGTVFATQEPVLAFAGVLGLAGLGLAFVAPKQFFGFSLAVIIGSAVVEAFIPDTQVGLVDEAVVLLSVVAFSVQRLFKHRSLVSLPGFGWFMGFLILGLISAVVREAPPMVALQGAFLAVKALLFGFAAAQLGWEDGDLKRFIKWGSVGAVIILACAAVNLAIPTVWAQLILGYPSVEYTWGLPALIGPFGHPAELGRICALVAVAAFAYRVTVERTRLSMFLMVGGIVAGLLSFRIKTLTSLAAALGYIRLRFFNAGVVVAGFVVLPVLLVLFFEPLAEFIGADLQAYVFQDSARSVMSLGSLDVANSYFPFGAGFGRYGSFIAASSYSPEYIERGFHHVYGLGFTPGWGNFLTDTQWPAILGEAGWIGCLFFAMGLFRVFQFLRRPGVDEAPLVRWVRVTGLGWFVLFLVESIAAPVFGSAPTYPFAFLMVGILAAMTTQKN